MSEDREEYHDWSTPEASKKTIERRFQEVLRNNAVVRVTMKSPNPHNLSEVEWLKICIIQLDRVNYASLWPSTIGPKPSASATSAAPAASSPPSTAVEPAC